MKDEIPEARKRLSDNLKTLMKAHPNLSTIKKVAEKSTLSNGKVGRIYAASHPTDIDSIHLLAAAFGVDPWQLLVEQLDPQALPQLASPQLLNEIRALVHNEKPKSTTQRGSGKHLVLTEEPLRAPENKRRSR